jgi:hypothetical protein
MIDAIPFKKLNVLSLTALNNIMLLPSSKSNDQIRSVVTAGLEA